jgi:Radical SAM superfamily
MRIAPSNFLSVVVGGSFSFVGNNALPASSGPSVYAALEVGEACQLTCTHCIYSDRPPQRPNPGLHAALVAMLASPHKPRVVSFSGKEPTLFPRELFSLAELARSAGVFSILVTNGLRLSGALSARAGALFDQIDVSLDGDRVDHDRIRGARTFDKTWQRLVATYEAHPRPRFGAVATAMRTGPAGSNIASVLDLAARLKAQFGSDGRMALAVSLYAGGPADPMRLRATDLVQLLDGLANRGFPSRVLYSANYSHMWTEVARELEIPPVAPEIDAATGIPVIKHDDLRILMFNQTQRGQYFVRLGNDGNAYLGCGHLSLQTRENFRISTIEPTGLIPAIETVVSGSAPMIQILSRTAPACHQCPEWDGCRGGDRQSGLFYLGAANDPYCKRLPHPRAPVWQIRTTA